MSTPRTNTRNVAAQLITLESCSASGFTLVIQGETTGKKRLKIRARVTWAEVPYLIERLRKEWGPIHVSEHDRLHRIAAAVGFIRNPQP